MNNQIFSIGFQMFKIYVLADGSKHVGIAIQWHQNSFPKKSIKNRPAAGGFAPIPPSVIRLSYTSLLNTRPNSHFLLWV